MAFTASAIFRAWVTNPLFNGSGGTPPTSYTGYLTDTMKCALYDLTAPTPDKDAAVGSTGYNTGAWVTGNEKTGSSEWVAGGRALASKTNTNPASGVIMLDAADLTGSASITMTNVGGCLIYDDTITAGTVADQGMCYLYFGGAQSVTSGTFSVAFNANGLMRITI
jgi:hypothetical protein